MANANTPLKVNRGTTHKLDLEYNEDGAAASLSGCTIFFTVKTTEYDTDDTDAAALIKKTKTTFLETGDNPTAGVAVIVINPTDTQDITPGNYWYDLKVKKSTGEIYKIVEGRFKLDGSPTNRES